MKFRNLWCPTAGKSRQTFLAIAWVCTLMALSASVLWAAGRAAEATTPEGAVQLPVSVKNQGQDRQSKKIELEAAYGYRLDRLDWSIAGDSQGNNPNILSELTWKDLLIHELHLGMKVNLARAIYLKGSLNYGVIVDGETQDSDYAADDRAVEYSRSNNDANQGSTLDGVFGAGYRFRPVSKSFSVIPLVGYSYHRQQLTLTNGYQTITGEGGPPLGPFGGLDSTYEAEWRGPWAGLDLILETERFAWRLPSMVFYAGWEYHWAAYYAEADWNLRDDFMHPKSFEHEADGNGMLVNLGIRMHMHDRMSLTLGYETETWSTEEGIDRVFLANGSIVETCLNEVNWHSETYLFGVVVHF